MSPAFARRLTLAGLLSLLLSACSAADLLNATVPKDGYTLSEGIAFGDDPRHRLDVYVPEGLTGPAPVVVFFYGGNWSDGDRGDYLFVGQALASRGFVAVLPDYRLVPETAYPGFLADGAMAVRWVRESISDHNGDPERIFLMGHSAGAYNAAMLTLDPRYLAEAGVDRGVIDGMIGLAGPYDFLPLNSGVTRRVFGNVADLEGTQPVTFVDDRAPPLLLLTGREDTTVRPRNSESLAGHVNQSGGSATLILYPEIGHVGLVLALADGHRDSAPALDDVEAFIRGR